MVLATTVTLTSPHAYPISQTWHDQARPRKRQKKDHYCSEIVVQIPGTKQLLRVLLDSGSTDYIILKDFINCKMLSRYKRKPTQWKTMGGIFTTRRKALVEFTLPEFSTHKKVSWSCHVDETTDPAKANYDMIIGDKLMAALGIDLLYSTEIPTVRWEEVEVPMRPKGTLQDDELLHSIQQTVMDAQSAPLRKAEQRRIEILDVDEKTYAKQDLAAFCASLEHLSLEEQSELCTVLSSCPTLFSGGLGTATVEPVDFELVPDAKPHHIKRPFSIPRCYTETTRKEIDRLCKLGVLEKRADSEWACGTFIIPKKTHDVRVVTDYRVLNTMLVRRPFPIPKIKDLLQNLTGFRYATAIDLSMGYYSIPLSEKAQQLTSFLLPWGKYRYKRLPMGVKVATDVFQEVMNHVLGDLDYVQVYLDDVLLLTDGSYEDHMEKLKVVMQRLDEHNFRCRVDKCNFAVTGVEYLGYWLSRDGLSPQPKKVEAIHRMVAPTTRRQLRRFLGLVNFYRDMWKRRSHILAPLTKISSDQVPFEWKEEQQKAFDEIKRVISKEVMLSFPDFSKEFHVYTDASDYQLGGVIMQSNKPLAFYSRKLTSAQKNYTTGEKELLSVIEVLREFRNILLGHKLVIHTDHKNLLYKSLSSPRLERWRMLLEEFDMTLEHVAGEANIVADGISRLDADFEDSLTEDSDLSGHETAYLMARMEIDESIEVKDEVDRYDMAKSYANSKDLGETDFPMAPELLQKYQSKDKTLQKHLKDPKKKKDYAIKKVEGVPLIHLKDKICVPFPLQDRIVAWYHEYLAHPGETRTYQTISKNFTWPGLASKVKSYCKTCKQCQLWKKKRKKYGELPNKDAEATPWDEVHVDLMGPFTVRTPKKTHKFLCFMAIDPATGWFECIQVPDSYAFTIMEAFNNVWLCRYPRPRLVRYDNGTEFKSVFKEMCHNYGLKSKNTTTYNPRSNGIIERVHGVLRDSLNTFELSKQELPSYDPFGSFISAACFAIRSTVHSTLQATPGELVFGRDMLLNIPFNADWNAIKLRKQGLIDKGVVRENQTRIPHDYKVGDKVLYEKPGIVPKMNQPRTGPHEVKQVFTNGTILIQRGVVTERVNIRNVSPFFE